MKLYELPFSRPVIVFSPPQIVDVSGRVTLRSSIALETNGVHFVVHPGGSLTLIAPSIWMSRPTAEVNLKKYCVSNTSQTAPHRAAVV